VKGDFSVLYFDPLENERGVAEPRDGALRNLGAVLFQQGRVMTDADHTESELLDLAWREQAARDVIGAGVCAVPAEAPDSFKIVSANATSGETIVSLLPGRCWADGLLTRLAGDAPNATAAVKRRATYFGPPIASPMPTTGEIGDGVRDAVVLEVWIDSLHAYQYTERLLEAALGGPDTSERAFLDWRLRLLRLADGESCATIAGKLRDDPATKGGLEVTLAPKVAIVGDCPVVGGGGYTGFEHALYRIEIADTKPADPARFKWSRWNGSLVGAGVFDATVNPNRVTIEAGRAAIVTCGETDFYLEALAYDALDGGWNVIYAARATLNADHDIELAAPPLFGAFPSTTDSVFFRLWNGVADIASFTDAAAPVELRDGIRLVFDAPGSGKYRPGDYWTFDVRAGEIANPQTLIEHAPPQGVVKHRVALAEIEWTGRRDTTISGAIEDCRKRFRPLVNQKLCCTFLVGDGVTSFGDFNSLEEAAAHLPPTGGELCLLPGAHRANLRLEGKRHVKIHGCKWRSLVLPRENAPQAPVLTVVDCLGVEIEGLDLVTFDGVAVLAQSSGKNLCADLRIHDNRIFARANAIRVEGAREVVIARNRLHLLDTTDGLATLSLLAEDALVERNVLALLPFTEPPRGGGGNDPSIDPADPCARTPILYRYPAQVLKYVVAAWIFPIAQLAPKQPYRALGGIHLRAGCERVRLSENRIAGGAGNGVTLGGDLDPVVETADAETKDAPTINVSEAGYVVALAQDESGRPIADVDIWLEGDDTAADRSDARGMVAVKTAPGRRRVSASPPYEVTRIAETRDAGRPMEVITLTTKTSVGRGLRGFLHEIAIEENDISVMGLSGIGFTTRAGARLASKKPAIPANDPKGALFAQIDLAISGLAATPLLRASDPARDLVIRGNRIRGNLRNPFTEAMLAEAQDIGRGGVSLGVVDALVLADNHIADNGPDAADPVCGVFVGYGNNLEITGNSLSGNGAPSSDYERKRRAGLRGGLYVRFAGALTSSLSTSSGREAALRVLDNRIDQPAGRALTAFAFGPVTVAGNHFNSLYTGLFGFIDAVFGVALLVNLGGVHRLLARRFQKYLARGKEFAGVAERSLPGGETIVDGNYLRLDPLNRSITSHAVLALDDIGYATNTSSVYRSDPFFANAILVADTLRATGARLREDAATTLSMLTQALRANVTALNQGDHCIIARPGVIIGNPLPTVAEGNQVLDPRICARLAEPQGLLAFAIAILRAQAEGLGGTLDEKAFTGAEIVDLGQSAVAKSASTIAAAQTAAMRDMQFEAARLAERHGADYPAATLLRARAEAGLAQTRLMTQGAEALSVAPVVAPDGGAAISGRAVDDRGLGLRDLTVELVRRDATIAETLGRTDATGVFVASFDKDHAAVLAREPTLFVRLRDANGKELLLDKDQIRIAAGVAEQLTLVVPLAVAPLSVIQTATPIYTRASGATQTNASTTPAPGAAAHTPLSKLDIDAALRERLRVAGVADVESILALEPAKLADIVGGAAPADTIVARAKTLLATR